MVYRFLKRFSQSKKLLFCAQFYRLPYFHPVFAFSLIDLSPCVSGHAGCPIRKVLLLCNSAAFLWLLLFIPPTLFFKVSKSKSKLTRVFFKVDYGRDHTLFALREGYVWITKELVDRPAWF